MKLQSPPVQATGSAATQSKAKPSRAIAISFSGIDGAGKSTQIDALSAAFTGMGLRVRMIRFWDDVARLKQIRETSGHRLFKGDRGVGSPSTPINRRDKNVQSWPMTGVRLFLYLVDALSMRRIARHAVCRDVDVVIFDRYTWDELANLNLDNPVLRAYVRVILRLVPRPDVSYLLDADPVKARARKPEYPLDFLNKNRASYLKLAALVGRITVIPPMSVDEVKTQVFKHACEALDSVSLAGGVSFAETASVAGNEIGRTRGNPAVP
jgi:thymidylate kinase